jgi:hypothetical protein
MAGGLGDGLFQNEAAFMIMNGAFPLVAGMLLTAFHPGVAFGTTAWERTSPRRPKQPGSLPAREDQPRTRYSPHHAYDPNIRTRVSPRSYRARPSAKGLSPPHIPFGSPGLPANPRPVQKPPSPVMPSPKSTVPSDRRFSDRSGRRLDVGRDMVDSDTLW